MDGQITNENRLQGQYDTESNMKGQNKILKCRGSEWNNLKLMCSLV